jgi:hypothetical protein
LHQSLSQRSSTNRASKAIWISISARWTSKKAKASSIFLNSIFKETAMDKTGQTHWDNLWGRDRERQNQAFFYILEVTAEPVDWAYEVWDEVLENLGHGDNHNRAIAAQVLCNLAKSDPEKRVLEDFPALLAVTKDARFVTARHCLQALWKVGTAGEEQRKMLVEGLEGHFRECLSEKNWSLIRYDIIQSLRNVYDGVQDEAVKAKALELIETEEDPNYRKKYAKVWKVK